MFPNGICQVCNKSEVNKDGSIPWKTEMQCVTLGDMRWLSICKSCLSIYTIKREEEKCSCGEDKIWRYCHSCWWEYSDPWYWYVIYKNWNTKTLCVDSNI